jgi:hypothetical protein
MNTLRLIWRPPLKYFISYYRKDFNYLGHLGQKKGEENKSLIFACPFFIPNTKSPEMSMEVLEKTLRLIERLSN